MSSESLAAEVFAKRWSEDNGLIQLRIMAVYADCIANVDNDTSPRKRLELAEIAEGQGWPELWKRHGLDFPRLPPDVREQALATPPEPEPEPADLLAEATAAASKPGPPRMTPPTLTRR